MVRYVSEINDLFHYLLEAKKCHGLKKLYRGEAVSNITQYIGVSCRGDLSVSFYWNADSRKWQGMEVYLPNRGLARGVLRRTFFFKQGITSKEIMVLFEEVVEAFYNSVNGVVMVSHRYFADSIPEF